MPLKRQRSEQPVSALRNLGPKSALALASAGIATLDELHEIGAVRAYLRVKEMRPKQTSLNLLWALAAGLASRDWRDLSPDEKTSLLAEVRRLRR